MSQPSDERRADAIREIHDALDTVERCVRQIASDPIRSELIDLTIDLRGRISRMPAETESTDEKERSSSSK